MEFRVVDRKGLDIPAWETLARNGSFFHTISWSDICIDGLSSKAEAVFLCGYESNILVAAMPGIITRRWGFKSFYSMPDGTYGAPVYACDCNTELQNSFRSHISAYLSRSGFSRIVIADFDGKLRDWDQHDLVRTRHFTHVISLEEAGDYRPDPKIESHLRTGQKRPSEIIEIDDPSRVEAYYRLYRLTEIRHGGGGPRREKKFFDSLWHHLNGSEKLLWTGLMADNVMVGSQIHFIHGDTLFNWQTVSDYEQRRYKPNQILMYDAIGMAIKRGLKKVNLGASPLEASGLIDYKERWQGRKVEYDILSAESRLRRWLRR